MGQFFSIETSQAALAFVLGGVLFLSGAFLIVLVVRQYLRERQADEPQSLLAPVLAADTLAPARRVLWVKTMLIEAEAPDEFAAPAGKLARELRRCIVRAQSLAVSGGSERAVPLESAIRETLEGALQSFRSSNPSDLAALRAELSRKRTALDESPRAAEPDTFKAEGSPHPVTD